jgi:parallel beta-helix repeat protein
VDVSCGAGGTIAAALNQTPGRPLTINVTGPCTENVTITRDDVTLQGAVAGTVINAAVATSPTILMNGARRIILSNLDVRGGNRGVNGLRGASFDLRNCTVQNAASNQGVIVSNASVAVVDNCTVQNNPTGGLAATNGAELYVTNTTVQNNGGTAILAVRSSYVRVGQDFAGSASLGPVTITGNAGNGVLITENSAGTIVGGLIEANTTVNSLVSISRGSSASIGVGSNSVFGAVTIRNGLSEGIFVGQSAFAEIVGNTITGNSGRGILLTEGASGRIGINPATNAFVANNISNNRQSGIQVSDGASAAIAGNTISSNGTDTAAGNRNGVAVFGATAVIPSGNTIQNNPSSGLFVGRGGNAVVGAGYGFLPTTANIFSNNGADVATTGNGGGIFVYNGGAADIRSASITGNTGGGVLLYEGAVADLRDITISGSVVGTAGFHGGHGISALFKSTFRIRGVSAVNNNAGDGVRLDAGSGAEFSTFTGGPTTVTGNAGNGLNCIGGAETSFFGNTTGITGNTGANINAVCTGF